MTDKPPGGTVVPNVCVGKFMCVCVAYPEKKSQSISPTIIEKYQSTLVEI